MPELTPTLTLLVGIVLILLILLGLFWSNRRHKALVQHQHFRTANGRLIEQQTHRIQSQAMATRRVRAGKVVPLELATHLHRVEVTPQARRLDIFRRGALARKHDDERGSLRRSPSPYTMGTVEHGWWLDGYNGDPQTAQAYNPFPQPDAISRSPVPKTVQTSARSEDERAAA